MELNATWRMLVDDEPFDPESNRVIELRGSVALDNRGARGSVAKGPGKLLIAFTHLRDENGHVLQERIVIPDEQKSPDAKTGMLYWEVDRQLPADPSSLFREAEAADDDALYDALPMAEGIRLIPLEEGEVSLISELYVPAPELDGEQVSDGVVGSAVGRLI